MRNILKKTIISLFLIFTIVPLIAGTQIGNSSNLTKTVEFFIGQDSTARASGETASFYFNNVDIPETPAVQSAIIEISGVSYNNSGTQTINVDLEQGVLPAGTGIDYTLSGTTKAGSFSLKYDAWRNGTGPMSDIMAAGAYDYTLYVKGTSAGGSGSYSISSAKLVLTYDYSLSGTNFLKTTKFLLDQQAGIKNSGEEISRDFAVAISENSPAIESVFVEVSGNVKGSGSGNVGVSLVDKGSPANYSYYNVDLGPSAGTTNLKIRHDASSGIVSSSYPGNKDYTLYLKVTGFSNSLLAAKLIVTYKYSDGTGLFPASGSVISSTVDTGATQGAAFNSLMWKGTLPAGKVQFQLATSNSETGPWFYEGPGCTSLSNDVYEPAAGAPVEILCASDHNNKRYFRYKMTVCSSDCTSGGSSTPEVTEVVVNWSP